MEFSPVNPFPKYTIENRVGKSFSLLAARSARCVSNNFICALPHIKIVTVQPRTLQQMQSPGPNWLPEINFMGAYSSRSAFNIEKAIFVAWSATLSKPDTISENNIPASGLHSFLVSRPTWSFCSSLSFSSTASSRRIISSKWSSVPVENISSEY